MEYIVKFTMLTIILSSCLLFFCCFDSNTSTYYTNAVWSDDDSEIAFTIEKQSNIPIFSPKPYYGYSVMELAFIDPVTLSIQKTGIFEEVEYDDMNKHLLDKIYYMKKVGYILYTFSEVIKIYYIDNNKATFISKTIPPSGIRSTISAIPSPDGSKIAIISPLPWCNTHKKYTNQCNEEHVYGGVSKPDYCVHIKFIDSQTLKVISVYISDWTTPELIIVSYIHGYFKSFKKYFRWNLDETFLVHQKDTTKYYKIDPINSTYVITEEKDFSYYPSTTSSEVSQINNEVYFKDNILQITPNEEDLGDSPFIK